MIARNPFVNMTSATTPALVLTYPTGAEVAAAWARLNLGAFDDTTIFFQFLRDAASAATGVTLKLQIASTDTEAEYVDVFSTLHTSGATAIEHTIAVAAGQTGFNAISTTNLRNAPFSRLLVHSTVAVAALTDRFQAFYAVRRSREIAE